MQCPTADKKAQDWSINFQETVQRAFFRHRLTPYHGNQNSLGPQFFYGHFETKSPLSGKNVRRWVNYFPRNTQDR